MVWWISKTRVQDSKRKRDQRNKLDDSSYLEDFYCNLMFLFVKMVAHSL